MQIDSGNDSLLTFDSLIITVHRKDGSFSQEVFHGVLRDPKQVSSMPLDVRMGDEYTISIIGYRGGKIGVSKEITFIGPTAQSKDIPIGIDKPDTVTIDPKIPELTVYDTSVSEGDTLRVPIRLRNPWNAAALGLRNSPAGSRLDSLGFGATELAYFCWRPDFHKSQAEPYSIGVVYASNSLKVEETFVVTILNVNRAPILGRMANIARNENELIEFNVTATDLDGDSLTISADSIPSNATLKKGVFSWKPEVMDVGNHTLTFRAFDGQASDSQTIILSIGAVNRPPEFLGISDTTVKEYDSLSLEIIANDPEGKAVSLTATGLPDSSKFIPISPGKGRLSWKVKGNQSRTEPYAIFLSASDGELEAKASLRIKVVDMPKKIDVTINSPLADAITNHKTIQVQWSINGVAQAPTMESLKNEGANLITRTYNDGDGNSGTASITVYRDTLPPEKPNVTGPAFAIGLPNLTWPQAETRLVYEYRLIRTGNTTPIATGTTVGNGFPLEGTTPPTVSSGEYWFYVKSVDRGGNPSAETGHRILIDMVAPSISITRPAEMGRTTSIDPIIMGTASDNLGLKTLTYSVQDSAPKPIIPDKGKWNLSGLKFSEGSNRVLITAKDSADGETTTSIIITKLPKVVFVREGSDGSGTSWEDALPDLDVALNPVYLAKYPSGTQIWATAGNYPRGKESSLYMKSNLSFYGGFSKTQPQSSPSARDTSNGRSYFYIEQGGTDLFNVAEQDPVTFQGGVRDSV